MIYWNFISKRRNRGHCVSDKHISCFFQTWLKNTNIYFYYFIFEIPSNHPPQESPPPQKKIKNNIFFAFLEDNVINDHTPTLYTPLHSTPPSFVIEIEIGPYTFKNKNRWAVCTRKAVLVLKFDFTFVWLISTC